MFFRSIPVLPVLLFLLLFSFSTYNNSYSGGLSLPNSETDSTVYQLYSFYDFRDRESFIQVTSPDNAVTIHFQVFDVSNLCIENNFFDTYTPNDTHIYNMRDVLTNNGNPSGVVLEDGAYGFVVVTAVLAQGQPADTDANIIGNFRVIDDAGYEYRTNSQNGTLLTDLNGNRFTFNYSSTNGVNASDVVGITANNIESGEVTATVSGVNFDTNLYNNNEVPFSCNNTTFSCTEETFEYGINDALPNSRDGDVTCGSNIIDEGFLVLDRMTSNETELFAGYVGLNTGGSSRGSMDSMWTESIDELTMLSELCSDGIDNDQNGLTDCEETNCGQTPSCLSCEEDGFCRVFVTSTPTQNGNFGGVAGADAICQNLADNEGLDGNFRAWISDSLGNSPDSNFNKVTVEYQLVNGTVVASNYADLIDCTNPNCLINPINRTESNQLINSGFFAWTATLADGQPNANLSCNNWTNSNFSNFGFSGDLRETNSFWTLAGAGSCNNNENRLYCFEQ